MDANGVEDEILISQVEYALKRKGRGLAIAVNEGLLVKLLRAAKEHDWAESAQRQLMRPFVYRDDEDPGADPRVAVIDLNLRNNLARPVVTQAIERLLKLSAPCEGCPAARCGLQQGSARLSGESSARVAALLDAVAKTGFHATMRDLQGFLSYLLFGGASCEAFKSSGQGPRGYWMNAFEGGAGPLFDAVRAFDPRHRTLPMLDDALWRGVDRPEQWSLPSPEISHEGEDLEAKINAFISQKRRALFEHKNGDEILLVASDEVEDGFKQLLQGGKEATAHAVWLLNRFYDRDDDQRDVLHLWVTHRYDAHACRYAAASSALPTAQLEVLVPRLRSDLAAAFPDHHPDHVILCMRGQPASTGLRLDRPLVAALYAALQGLPSTFRRGEPETRIAAFFDKLAKLSPDDGGRRTDIRLVDRDTGVNLTIGVDVAGRRFISC